MLVVKKKTGLLGASKSKREIIQSKILDRVMGLGGMIMSINPEDMCEVSSEYIQYNCRYELTCKTLTRIFKVQKGG